MRPACLSLMRALQYAARAGERRAMAHDKAHKVLAIADVNRIAVSFIATKVQSVSTRLWAKTSTTLVYVQRKLSRKTKPQARAPYSRSGHPTKVGLCHTS